jgi:uncharacterized protein (TIGR00255 family)
MKSMTGYAYREFQDDGITVSVEIKGYNSRFLDLNVTLPPWLSSLESAVRNKIQARINRGKVEIYIRIKENDAPLRIIVNSNAAKAYEEAIIKLAGDLGRNEKPSLGLILGLEGVIETDRMRDDERYRAMIEPLFEKAIEDFETERLREGKHTESDILIHVSNIEKKVEEIADEVPLMEKEIKDNLRSRFNELMGGMAVVDEGRIIAETAVLLMKYTVSEEISRLHSHLKEFRAENERNNSAGKKLDFLCQEINREINTIGSKTVILKVSQAVVEMKDSLENIREQLRNIE